MKINSFVLFCFFIVNGCDADQSLKSEVEMLRQEIEEIKEKRNIDEFLREIDKVAYLTPGSSGYSTIRFDLGLLTVRLVNITAYANGSKITLEFGNTLSGSVNGLKATLDWGKVDDKGTPINDNAKTKEVKLNQILRAGSWTRVPIVLDGIPPQEFGFVRVKDVTHSGIVLMKN